MFRGSVQGREGKASISIPCSSLTLGKRRLVQVGKCKKDSPAFLFCEADKGNNHRQGNNNLVFPFLEHSGNLLESLVFLKNRSISMGGGGGPWGSWDHSLGELTSGIIFTGTFGKE